MHATILSVLMVTTTAAQQVSSGSYATFLEPVRTSHACRLDDASYFRNLTYRFRGRLYPDTTPLTLRKGVYEDDLFIKGRPEWITTLEQQTHFSLGQSPALLLSLLANHVGGTGTAGHVLVMRCRDAQLETVFEAAGEGVEAAFYSGRGLEVRHPVWLPPDAHASPSRRVTERYSWDDSRGRFKLAGKSESALD